MHTDKLNSSILFESVKEGDVNAFELLFKGYYPRLKNYALRFVKFEQEAEDIVQESFVSFWEKREQLSSMSVKALLFTIVRNRCLNHLKHEAVVRSFNYQYQAGFEGGEQLYSLDFLGSADEAVLFDELKERVDKVVNSLPNRCKEVFLLSRFEGLKNREISEELNISLTAVEKHIAKAMKIFSAEFSKKELLLLYSIFLQSIM